MLTLLDTKDTYIPKSQNEFAHFKRNNVHKDYNVAQSMLNVSMAAITGAGLPYMYMFLRNFSTSNTDVTIVSFFATAGIMTFVLTLMGQHRKTEIEAYNTYNKLSDLLDRLPYAFLNHPNPDFTQLTANEKVTLWQLVAQWKILQSLVHTDMVQDIADGEHRADYETIERAVNAYPVDHNANSNCRYYAAIVFTLGLAAILCSGDAVGPVCKSVLQFLSLPHFAATVAQKTGVGPNEEDGARFAFWARFLFTMGPGIPYFVTNLIIYSRLLDENSAKPVFGDYQQVAPATTNCITRACTGLRSMFSRPRAANNDVPLNYGQLNDDAAIDFVPLPVPGSL